MASPSNPHNVNDCSEHQLSLSESSSTCSLPSLSLTTPAILPTPSIVAPPHLHLTPCTWENLDTFEQLPDQKYEIVNGLFVAMGAERKRHNRACCLLLKFIELCLLFEGHRTPSHQVVYRADKDDESPTNPKPNQRIPDICFTKRLPLSLDSPSVSPARTPTKPPHRSPARRNEGSSSMHTAQGVGVSSPIQRESPTYSSIIREKENLLMQFTVENPCSIAVEYTSKGTRETDMTNKWLEYAITGIPIYLIIDASDVSPDGKPRVIIGYLDSSIATPQCDRGVYMDNPKTIPVHKHAQNAFPLNDEFHTHSFDVVARNEKNNLYHKMVFEGSDYITFGPFASLNIKAEDIESPSYLEARIKKEMRKQGKSHLEYHKLMKEVDDLYEEMTKMQKDLEKERKRSRHYQQQSSHYQQQSSHYQQQSSHYQQQSSHHQQQSSHHQQRANRLEDKLNQEKQKNKLLEDSLAELRQDKRTISDRPEAAPLSNFQDAHASGPSHSSDHQRLSSRDRTPSQTNRGKSSSHSSDRSRSRSRSRWRTRHSRDNNARDDNYPASRTRAEPRTTPTTSAQPTHTQRMDQSSSSRKLSLSSHRLSRLSPNADHDADGKMSKKLSVQPTNIKKVDTSSSSSKKLSLSTPRLNQLSSNSDHDDGKKRRRDYSNDANKKETSNEKSGRFGPFRMFNSRNDSRNDAQSPPPKYERESRR